MSVTEINKPAPQAPATVAPSTPAVTPPAAPAPAAAKPAPAAPVTPPAPKAPLITGPQFDIPAEPCTMLATILSWPRSHGSLSELAFCGWLTDTVKAMGYNIEKWEEGSMFVEVPHKNGKKPTTLFSSHVDTVDGATDKDARKELCYDPNFGHIMLTPKNKVGSCLGADDGAGVWLMLKMLEKKVPGGYLFHRGEERGGISARANAQRRQRELRVFDVAVAFDRPRTNEVITHQGGVRCASDKFAIGLSTALNAHGFEYKPSTGGAYTDTKEYRSLIAECVNLGVGYHSQHNRHEYQDFAHLSALLDAACEIDWEALPVDRDPSDKDVYLASKGYGGVYHGSKSFTDTLLDDDDQYPLGFAPPSKQGNKPKGKSKSVASFVKEPTILEEMDNLLTPGAGFGIAELRAVVEDTPDEAVRLLAELFRERARLKADVQMLEGLIDFGPDQ